MVFNLQSGHEYMVETAMFNVQRAITLELPFMCFACRPRVLHITVKFHENISDGIRVTERTLMMEALTDGETEGHSKFKRV